MPVDLFSKIKNYTKVLLLIVRFTLKLAAAIEGRN